ncbi:MAG: 30S ribosomal protein S3 [Methanonatronarchaeales archaeon]|nr:30S ribosomal protein S3 [Methanonatronarchaeales archaeon]
MTVKQFIEEGLTRARIDEFLNEELARAGYGGAEVNRTPSGTQVTLYSEKPGMVIGKGGRNINELEEKFSEEFELDELSIEVMEVEEANLNAQIVAQRLSNALERGWYFRKAGYSTLRDIMNAGALGAEIVLKGKVTGSRSREEKFRDGYMKHCGEPAEDLVDTGYSLAKKKLGTIGVTVKIVPPDVTIPDLVEIRDIEEEEEEEIRLIADGEATGEGEGGEDEGETEYVECLECGGQYRQITGSHLSTHDMTMEEYREKHGEDVRTRV